MTEGVCIGGSKHGQWVAVLGYDFEAMVAESVSDFQEPSIPVPMSRAQRFFAKIIGIPTKVEQPVRMIGIKEHYRAFDFVIRGQRKTAFVLDGIDSRDPDITDQVALFYRLKEQKEYDRQMKQKEEEKRG